MRGAWSAVLLAALALPATALAAADVPAPPPFIAQIPSTDGFVHIRLSPDLGGAAAALKAELGSVAYVRFGDPADYELTTKTDFPQTLIAIDLHQDERDWDRDFSGDGPYEAPKTVELGNLVLGDYHQALSEVVSRAAVAKMLMAARPLAKNSDVETCLEWAGDPSPHCHVGLYRDSAPGEASPDDVDYDMSVVAVHNRAATPRYVRLFLIDPAFVTHRIDLGKPGSGQPLAAGATAKTQMIDVLGEPAGRYRVVTLWSDRPFGDDALLQPGASGVSASFAEYRQTPSEIAGMGGGEPILPGMAAFIAEMYSTVPYTAEEKAADALKPPAKREFLSERGNDDLAHRCGGSLIAPNLVLTAAHCVATGHYAGAGMVKVLAERRVRIESSVLGRDGTTYAIAGVAVPAEYHPEVSKDNDLALLLLKPDRDTQKLRVHTVSIAARPPAAGTPLNAFGWGYEGAVAAGANPLFDIQGQLQQSPTDLQFGKLAALPWDKCRDRMPVKVGSGMVCAVARAASKHNVFTCRGDSGGPLVELTGKREELVGVTSWSMGCGYQNYPSVFTDVTKYRAWIEAARKQLVAGSAIRVPLVPTAAAASEPAAHRR